MTQRIQHRRFTDAAANWPATAVMAGEVVVNPVRHALGIGDIDGMVRSIVDVRPFDARSQYVVGDLVTNAGTIYRCITAIGVPHVFNTAEWVSVSPTAAELQSQFDARYASISHNHDSQYAALGHLHDDRYSLLGHTHSGIYSPVGHNHDGIYAKLSGGNSFGAGVNSFGDIVNLAGSYTACYGWLSVGSAFVPAHPLHVRTGGQTTAMLESTVAQQVRLHLANPNRQYLFYEEGDGSFVAVYDLSSGGALQKWNAGAGGSRIYGGLIAEQWVSTPMLVGGAGGSGTLRTHGTANLLNFRWDGQDLLYRIDEVTERRIEAHNMTLTFRGPGATDWYMNVDRIYNTSDGTYRNVQLIVNANVSGPV